MAEPRQFVLGQDKVIANLRKFYTTTISRVLKHVANSAERVAAFAKADHTPGFAHAVGRYENQTTNLTNSIVPNPVEISPDRVHWDVGAHMEYAMYVELGTATAAPYPFMFPALQSQEHDWIEGFKEMGFSEV